MYTWNITLNLGDLIMTPQENIYRSDEDVVDGLDIRDMMEDDQYEHAFYDDVDDGQPDLEQECDDLYGYGPEWDCYHDCIDYPEDWG
jgi:hypothetical protein|tara:strand:+ start:143 stop:403 length:261 start_codon:yes stop_codon:yes gene_type:complete